MSKLLSLVEKFVTAEAKNPVVVRTVHTAWQAALGAGVASLSGTHGDVRVALMVAIAAAAAAVKNSLLKPVTSAPVVVPSMPASPASDTAPTTS